MYKQRIKILLALWVLVFVGIAARLGYLQLLKGDAYRAKVVELLQSVKFTPARRGKIIDRHGRILAIDEPCFDICLDYRFMTTDPKWIDRAERARVRRANRRLPRQARWIAGEQDRIKKQEGVSPERSEAIFRRRRLKTWRLAHRSAVENDQDLAESVGEIVSRYERMSSGGQKDIRELYRSHPVVRGLDETSAVAIKAELADTVGMEIQPSHRRWYPYGEHACHVVGVIDEVNRDTQASLNRPQFEPDWLTWQRDSYLAGDKIGISGVEKMCEPVLRGRRGYRRLKRGGPVLQDVPSSPGDDVQLTLDVALQAELQRIFIKQTGGVKNGCVVVLSVPRGEVLAMVSIPGYDLNRYRRDINDLIHDDVNFRLRSRTVAQQYPPGSTVKPITALAGLGEGVITLRTTYNCNGYLLPPGAPHRFACWIAKRGGSHGPLAVVDAIKNSCNIFFYHVGEKLQRRRSALLCEWFERFGFGQVPGTGLPEEVAGRLPGRIEYIGEARMLGIGQGPVSVTPLHVANAMAAIARDGEFLSPVLVRDAGPHQTRLSLPLRQEYIQAVQRGMREVCRPGGTAYAYLSGAKAEGEPLEVDVCGKTGTAGTGTPRGDMAWFVGFAPHDRPQIAFAVVVEYVTEGGGASNAGPVGRELIRICKRLGYIR
ncbi:MAG: penicillin-binding transpeptidase domain-containing protein [Planctomycetota bacterium]|nr:penicillin-binding transpeptidase domain-containing protein [Planctomycetota bacterium]